MHSVQYYSKLGATSSLHNFIFYAVIIFIITGVFSVLLHFSELCVCVCVCVCSFMEQFLLIEETSEAYHVTYVLQMLCIY